MSNIAITITERSNEAITIETNTNYGPFTPIIHVENAMPDPGDLVEDEFYIILE